MGQAFQLRGGIKLEPRKEPATQSLFQVASTPAEVVLPLEQHAGLPASACVKVGERVRMGQVVAEPADDFGSHMHAPVSGKVMAIEARPHRDGVALCIVLANDARDERDDSFLGAPKFASLDPAALRSLIGRGGLVGLGGAAFPTATKLQQGATAHAKELILNGAESEPYIACDQVLMELRAGEVLAGAQVLLHALEADRCRIVIEDDKPQALANMRSALGRLGDSRITINSLPSIYPAGWEGQIVAALTGREVPRGKLPADIGAICQNVATAAAVAAWVLRGEPLIKRMVTVAGGGVQQPRTLEARIGASLASLIADCGGYREGVEALIVGGPMMGLSVPSDQIPLVKATNCVLAALPSELQSRETLPCIRCGDCSLVCPAGLLPQQLDWYARVNNGGALEELGLWDCIECGCCDYVCPSQIPLAEHFRRAKQRYRRLP
jgi:electron transport complex protein RnfC